MGRPGEKRLRSERSDIVQRRTVEPANCIQVAAGSEPGGDDQGDGDGHAGPERPEMTPMSSPSVPAVPITGSQSLALTPEF